MLRKNEKYSHLGPDDLQFVVLDPFPRPEVGSEDPEKRKEKRRAGKEKKMDQIEVASRERLEETMKVEED